MFFPVDNILIKNFFFVFLKTKLSDSGMKGTKNAYRNDKARMAFCACLRSNRRGG